MRTPLLMMIALVLVGCESMTVSECKVADWGRVGFNDGARGESDSLIAAYTEDCGKAGIQPNARLYRQGWDSGIQRFCTAANGWREGLQGNSSKASVCRGQPGYEAFLHYLLAGTQVHSTTVRMSQNAAEINKLQRRLEESKSDEEKSRLREQLRDIDGEQNRLRHLLSQQQRSAP